MNTVLIKNTFSKSKDRVCFSNHEFLWVSQCSLKVIQKWRTSLILYIFNGDEIHKMMKPDTFYSHLHLCKSVEMPFPLFLPRFSMKFPEILMMRCILYHTKWNVNTKLINELKKTNRGNMHEN